MGKGSGKVIKVGDTITAKPKFLMKWEIPFEKRHMKITELWSGSGGRVESVVDKTIFIVGAIDFLNDFYLPSPINQEVMAILEANIDLKSFQAVTMDGKIIQIEG